MLHIKLAKNVCLSIERVLFENKFKLKKTVFSMFLVVMGMYVAMTIVLFLVQGHDGKTALHMTAFHGRFSRAQTLIQHGACSMFIVRVCVRVHACVCCMWAQEYVGKN